MNSQQIKEILLSEIHEVSINYEKYCNDPKRDLSRKRKLPFELMLKNIIGMGSKSITNELIDIFQASGEMPSASAFVQQRTKIKPEALKAVFDGFMSRILASADKMRILAVDGSDTQIETNPKDKMSHIPTSIDKKSFNLLHLNALYDLEEHVYTDAIILAAKSQNEHGALNEMVDRSEIPKALVIADRGYESYNDMAHIQEKGWFFLIRIKDGRNGIKMGLELPRRNEFDLDVSLKLTRKQTNDVKKLLKDKNHYRYIASSATFDFLPSHSRKSEHPRFYEINFRIVRFEITPGNYETVLTNLDVNKYPPKELKRLYALRWGIETSFRDLKYTVGMLNFHSKKVMCIHQEIYAHLIIYNFSEMITSHVDISKKKRLYTYKADFSVAVHVCRLFFYEKATSPGLEAIISKNLIPIRPDRHYTRKRSEKGFCGFLYRVA